MAVTLKALALYNNEAEDNDELSFRINDELIVIKENWQHGWHLCQLGEKRGVAPANYLQILANSTPNPPESIYDSPRSRNASGIVASSNHDQYINTSRSKLDGSAKGSDDGDTYVYPDYQNLSDDEDIYQNTSMMSLNTSSVTHVSPAKAPARAVPRDPLPRDPLSPPSRPVPTPDSSPPRSRINYPAEPPTYNVNKVPLVTQTSDYMEMAGGEEDDVDYDEVADQPDYDIVPVRSSNESMRSSGSNMASTQIYPMSPPHLSTDSLQSSRSSVSSAKHGRRESPPSLPGPRRDSPPSLPSKHIQSYIKFSPKETGDETSDYMVPPSARLNVVMHNNNRKSDHDYFHPPSPVSPIKPPLIKNNSDPSDVVTLETDYMTKEAINQRLKHNKPHSPSLDKRKKKSPAAVDQLPRIFNSLTMSKKSKEVHKHVEPQLPAPNRPLPEPPVKTSGEVSRGPHNKIVYKDRPLPAPHNKDRPLPAPPLPPGHDSQDYVEIGSDEEDGPDYADIGDEHATHMTHGHVPHGHVPRVLERQRSRSVTNSPYSVDNTNKVRRHSSPTRPDLVYDDDDDDENHDYTEVPDIPPGYRGPSSYHSNHAAGYPANSYTSCQSISSTESTSSGGSSGGYPAVPAHYPRPPTSHPPALPTTRPPPPPSQPPPGSGVRPPAPGSGVRAPLPPPGSTPGVRPPLPPPAAALPAQNSTPPPRPTAPQNSTPPPRSTSVYSPTTLAKLPATTYTPSPDPVSPTFDHKPGIPASYYESRNNSNYIHKQALHHSEVDARALRESEKVLIRVHCGAISSTLLRPATEALIKLKHCTDNKLHEHYIDVCKSTAGSCIEIVKHLTVLADKAETQLLYDNTNYHKHQLRDVLKQLIEAIKIAKVQFPALVAHNHMISKRNELITCIKEIKTYVVKLLQAV